MTTTTSPGVAEPAESGTRRAGGRGRADGALLLAALLSCAIGVVAGLFGGPLWLDEAISVEIASRPLPALFEALRMDGSPPLYYLLLHAWTAEFGTGTVTVRLLTVLLMPLALWLTWLLGRQLHGPAGGRAAVVALAALPWTMRYGSETRMYLLVVVLVLAGTLALRAVRTSPSWPAVAALGGCVGALLLTHYWSLFLLAAVAAWHVPGVRRREAAALRVAAGFLVGGVIFLPWLPTFLFQAAHTGAPWATPPDLQALLQTSTFWGGGAFPGRVVLALLIVPLVVLAAARLRTGQALAAVVGGTLLLAWVGAQVSDGAYTGRYTAVVVPLVAVAVGLGATTLRGDRPAIALALVVLVGAATGVPAAAAPRTSTAAGIAEAFTDTAEPGDVLVYCPDQLGPPVARLIGSGYRQVVYPTLGEPELVDWVDYARRNAAANPARVAVRVHAFATGRQLFVLAASGYRTLESGGSSDRKDDCHNLLTSARALRGAPEHLFGEPGSKGPQLFRFDAD